MVVKLLPHTSHKMSHWNYGLGMRWCEICKGKQYDDWFNPIISKRTNLDQILTAHCTGSSVQEISHKHVLGYN